ncbi:MAG: PD-(D/E)XK nuclease domain-containing protein [Leadbetterella sp.]|nr:PD-(D/E)XK nuclease domain-containing protein [Leadbetterella sp.]
MDEVIKSLSVMLENDHKNISNLLVFSKHNINESGNFGSKAHSIISTFEIISPPLQTSKLDDLGEEGKEIILKKVLLLCPIKDNSPEIREIIYKVDEKLSGEYEFVQSINDLELINNISIAINLLERKPPKFWIDYKLNPQATLLENDFRSEFFRMLGMKYQIGSEEESKTGRTDLILKSSSINRKIFEFKVWNRNDHLNTSTQLLKYLTEIDDSGFVIMCNNSRTKNIDENEYKKVIECEYYVSKSMKSNKTEHGLKYYAADYQYNGNSKKIYHFILNLK